jgi:hypothetical protein
VGGSDSEEEAEEQMRISFLGDVKQGGRTSKGVLAGVADEVRPDSSLTHTLCYSFRLWQRSPKRMISLSCSIKAKP